MEVAFSIQARRDLIELRKYIEGKSFPENAAGYMERLTAKFRSLAEMPEQGRTHIAFGREVRVTGFERRVSIAFRVERTTLRILSVAYAGKRLTWAFDLDEK